MHRAIAAWLTEHPWRAAVASAVCGALSPQMIMPFPLLAVAIPVLVALRLDGRTALAVAATSAAAAGWVVFSVSQPPPWVLAIIALLVFSPVVLALLLKRTGSMNLCFQVAVLGAAVAVAIVYLALPDPIAIWTELLHQFRDSLASAGLKLAADQGGEEAILLMWARTMWGAMAAFALATVFGGLLLGRWWQLLLQAPGSFGAEYRRLRLGVTLGVAITVQFVLAFLTDSPLVASLGWIAFAALVFQGLAAAHRGRAGGWLNKSWLAAIYVLLIMPLSAGFTAVLLALWGFADNWLRPRAQMSR
jgi:hypothetical protein